MAASVLLIIAMRRIPAILLVVLYGFSLISAAWFSPDAGSGLPACCRRDGKHHCEMTASRAEVSADHSVLETRLSFNKVVEHAELLSRVNFP